jgi:O-antigen ligase
MLTNSIIVIQRNPWFGVYDYYTQPEMEALRTGEGIIDVVNSYLGVVLEIGLVGLGLYVGFFAITLLGIYSALRSLPDENSEERLLGRVLLATQVAVMVIIFTVSSITIIPVVYWSIAGLGMAYTQMIRKNKV